MSSSRGLRKLQRRNVGRGELHTRFNIFTYNGENRTVTAPYPMSLDEAKRYFIALCIGADD